MPSRRRSRLMPSRCLVSRFSCVELCPLGVFFSKRARMASLVSYLPFCFGSRNVPHEVFPEPCFPLLLATSSMLDNPQSWNVRICELDGQQQKRFVLAIKVYVIHGKQVEEFINLLLFCLGRSIDGLKKLADVLFSCSLGVST